MRFSCRTRESDALSASFHWQALCTIERQVVGWFDVAEPQRFQPENFPIFIIRSERGDYYGATLLPVC